MREYEVLKPHILVLLRRRVPVGPPDTVECLFKLVDQPIGLEIPSPFYTVGSYSHNFPQVSDDEVLNLLKKRNMNN